MSIELFFFFTGQYRSTYSGCREHFEDLQQDLAVIGQIAGLVATLRRSYRVSLIRVLQLFVYSALKKRKYNLAFDIKMSHTLRAMGILWMILASV